MPIDNSVGRSIIFRKGRLAQLARASRLHREGRGFESLNAHFKSFVKHCFTELFLFAEPDRKFETSRHRIKRYANFSVNLRL